VLVEAVVRPASATPVVAIAGILLIVAVSSVLFLAFLFHRRSGRR
jgi:hypothetical protein